jgi:hypothetical protein
MTNSELLTELEELQDELDTLLILLMLAGEGLEELIGDE